VIKKTFTLEELPKTDCNYGYSLPKNINKKLKKEGLQSKIAVENLDSDRSEYEDEMDESNRSDESDNESDEKSEEE
jgi:hypothetical protein